VSDTIEYTGRLTVLTCWCGMRHAVPEELRRQQVRQQDRGESVTSVYCPLGHSHIPAGKSQATIERERRERLEAQLQHERDQHQAERRSHAATKGQLTKTKKRISGGTCPCCNRSFVNLARHMKGQHPEYVDGSES
jgi:DNA repair exonuclease SbcCD ATPase subunit